MDSKIVNKYIREFFKPMLKENGFTQFTSRSAWRYRNNRIDVLNFQSFNSYLAEMVGCTTYSFAVNLGCFLLYCPVRSGMKEKDGYLLPEEYSCHFRGRLFRTFDQIELDRKDTWYIDPGGNYLPQAMEDVRCQFNQKALPWYDKLTSDIEILRILKEDKPTRILGGFGSNPSPQRSLVTAYVALHLGEKEIAKQKLDEAIKSGCFTYVLEQLKNSLNKLN